MMSEKNIQGFTVLPLRFSSESSTGHDIYLKEHSVRGFDEKKPPGRTLFVLNLPPYVDEHNLMRAFSLAGKIKSVTVQENFSEHSNDCKSCGFKVAYVVFQKREALMKSLKLTHLNPLTSKDDHTTVGLRKWIQEYNSSVYNHEKLEQQVNDFVLKQDKEEAEKATVKEVVDDEGWTVVTKKGRNPGLSRKESVENKIIKKNKLKSKKKELKNFYTFQLKEQKMKSIIALRKSFQESKEKVQLMKTMRTFKPF